MFFTRLRRQAKWVFILLIVVFGAGFVFLGVGSGGLDLGTLVQNLNIGGGSSKPSLSKAQDEVQKHPASAAAYRHLTKALQARGSTAEAIVALQRVATLAPKDGDSLRQLASLQQNEAATAYQQAVAAYVEYQASLSAQSFGPPTASKIGQALAQDPITSVVSSGASSRYSQALATYQSAGAAVVATFKKLADLAPRDWTLQLARQATNYRDYPTAIAAYKRFLALNPNSGEARDVRTLLKRLQQAQRATSPGASAGG